MLLPTARYLIIPDVHQNLRWVEGILDRDLDDADAVIFLGDYFDPKLNAAASADRVAEFFARLPASLPKPIHFLVGNHDLPYLFDLQCRWEGAVPLDNPYRCSGYMPERSRWIVKEWNQDFCARLHPLFFANGYAISHAGLHRAHFANLAGKQPPTLDDLLALSLKLKNSLDDLQTGIDPQLFAVAKARGGADPVGSLTWLDWGSEFEDDLPWPQIVGHTVQPKPQRNGRSWNIDTRGCHYGLLTPTGFETRKA